MKALAGVAVALLLAMSAHAQDVRLVEGHVYSYADPNGVRHYTSSQPPPGSRDVRRIRYWFNETQVSPAPVLSRPMGRRFGPYSCTQDCSGHEAGYQWAQDRGITDPYQCGGRSQSFIEGCMAYAEGY